LRPALGVASALQSPSTSQSGERLYRVRTQRYPGEVPCNGRPHHQELPVLVRGVADRQTAHLAGTPAVAAADRTVHYPSWFRACERELERLREVSSAAHSRAMNRLLWVPRGRGLQ